MSHREFQLITSEILRPRSQGVVAKVAKVVAKVVVAKVVVVVVAKVVVAKVVVAKVVVAKVAKESPPQIFPISLFANEVL